jgi:hypothetical protein
MDKMAQNTMKKRLHSLRNLKNPDGKEHSAEKRNIS